MDTPDHLPDVVVSRGRHRACIQDDEIRIASSGSRLKSATLHQRFERGAVSLRSPASEISHKKRDH